ncbi:helix-turn-helix transcriptional regulator [Streptomyces zagrosensis]|uniref:DNA-binding CsgD family transcriptional regulator n=1 Tax=Streptomyces zagrosensis TaxID=1042984 RepID=A0A7W9V0Z0_9ACTN|nr:LuxR family transcriptional regulator [Streptomyces zagrosensis]MBB5937244.1 DNA-binding CsgD family transcriptional regulator [Streptomyces zagrosensis]
MPTHGKTTLVGRREEVRAVSMALRQTGENARVLLLRGESGIGKTTVLEAADHLAARSGVLVLRVGLTPHGRTGLDSLAHQIGDLLVKVIEHDALPLVAAVRRAQVEASRDRRHLLPALLETQALVRHAALRQRVAVVLDDAHHVNEGDVGALGALLCGLRTDGVPVVVSGQLLPGGSGALHALAAAADRTVEVPPLTWEQTSTLAGRRLGLLAAPELVSAVRRGLGAWAGNPRAVLSTVGALWESDQLMVVDGHACPADPQLAVHLPIGHAVLDRTWCAAEGSALTNLGFLKEALALLARLTSVAETTVDDFLDLAPELGGSVPHIGRALDALVEHRMVTVTDEQRLACAVPALGTALQTSPARWYEARLHAQVVLNAQRRAGGTHGALDPRLCDHVLAAGAELPDSLSNDILLATVRRDHGGQRRRTAARACLALFHQLPADDADLPAILRGAIALMLDHGDATALLRLGNQLLPEADDFALRHREYLPDLASAWALAALHEQWLGNYVVAYDSPPARTAMRVPPAAALVALALRMRGLPPPPSSAGPLLDLPAQTRPTAVPLAEPPSLQIPAVAEMLLLTGTLGTRAEFNSGLSAVQSLRMDNGLPPLGDTEQLRGAAAFGDWATAFEAVLGDRCARFEDSPLRTYQSLVREYLTGSWDTALALARRVEMYSGGTGRGPLYDHSRSLAAEICRWQGDTARAAAWLAGAAAPHGRGPLASWARTGLQYDSGDAVGAWREGWREYRVLRAGGHLAGLERLLLRLAIYAVREGHDRAAREALGALEELHTCVDSTTTHVATLLARALVWDDVDSALAVHTLPAWQSDQMLSFMTSLWLARSTGEEKWLAEAWEWCERLSARRARQLLVDVAESLGLSLPRRRTSRSVFSAMELKVVQMVAGGRTNRQIAAVLARSEKSVETYLASVFDRTGCRSRLELATAWLDGGLARYVPH